MKKYAVWAIFFSALICIYIVFSGTEDTDRFNRELSEASRRGGGSDITELVSRHVAVGTSLVDAIRFFEARGFTVYETKKSDWGTRADSFSRYVARKQNVKNFIFQVEPVVVIVTDGDIVIAVSGKINITGL